MKRVFIALFLLSFLTLLFPRIAYAANPCDFAGEKAGECNSCMGEGKTGVWTAIGCLQTTFGTEDNFITSFLKIGSGIAGGIAFLLIIVGGFQMVMSAGNPEKLNEGKELVTSAIVGLLFVIFSVFILRLVGVDILGIPGFQ